MSIDSEFSGPKDRVEIVVAVALREEVTCVRHALNGLDASLASRVAWLRTGMGAGQAQEVEAFFQTVPSVRLICSSGFCGGLQPGVATGDLVFAKKVLDGCTASPGDVSGQSSQAFEIKEKYGPKLEGLLKDQQLPAHAGVLISVAEPLFESDQKRHMGESFSAQAVDMESGMLARIAEKMNVDFMVMRVVSDAAEDALPREVGTFLNENGKVRIGKIMGFIAKDIRNISELRRLKQRADLASKHLKSAWALVLPPLLK